MLFRWILLLCLWLPVVLAKLCNITYIDQSGYYPLRVDGVPPEECSIVNTCCWCSSGNATSAGEFCCLRVGSDTVRRAGFEDFAVSLCSANAGISSRGAARQCPATEQRLGNLNIPATLLAISAPRSSISTARGSSDITTTPVLAFSSFSKTTSRSPMMTTSKVLAIAIPVTMITTITIMLGVFLCFYHYRRNQKRKQVLPRFSELSTEVNRHELDGRPISKATLDTKPQELMASTITVVRYSPRSGDRTKTPKSTARPTVVTREQKQRETQSTTVSPMSTKSRGMHWSPIAVSPQEARSSKSSLHKPLPLPPPPPQLDFWTDMSREEEKRNRTP